MSLKARSLGIIVVGAVLGLVVSLGSILIAERDSAQEAVTEAALSLDVRLLTEALETVLREYVDVVDDRQLIESAIRGMISELDSHSRYLGPDDYEEVLIATTGNYAGVGLNVHLEEGKVRVVTTLEGTPAYRAGILPGDMVISVDNVPVQKDRVEETIVRMRGEPGTGVTVDVARDGQPGPLHFNLVRSEIEVTTVRSEYLGEGYGYIRLTGFSDSTKRDMTMAAKALSERAGNGLRGVVLDLRNNSGGILDAAVDVADAFLERGLIVRGTGRNRDARFERYAGEGDLLNGADLVVLVNAGSASAAEIVAGALKENNRAQLVGTKTYGKGTVQTVVPLVAGRAIKLTTARYLTPSGRAINGAGIEPDVIVHVPSPNDQFGRAGSKISADEDHQLQEALRLIGSRAGAPVVLRNTL